MEGNNRQFPYEDIINLPRPISSRRAKMSNMDRAAQFSPFSALSGYDEAITETARLTEGQRELADSEKARLCERLQFIAENNVTGYEIAIHYFKHDLLKMGGEYVTISGTVKKIDPYDHIVIMADGSRIPMDNIYSIEGELFADLGNNDSSW